MQLKVLYKGIQIAFKKLRMAPQANVFTSCMMNDIFVQLLFNSCPIH